jgi:YggT family protein
MTSIVQILLLVLDVVFFIIIVQAILSWLIAFQIINVHQPFVSQIWRALHRLTEPIYRPIRRFMPDLGGLDLTPMIVIIGIYALRILIINNLA